MDSTAFLVHTRSKSLTPLTQGTALPWWFVIEIGLPPALLSLMPPVQLWESFFFLKLHSFLVLMTKGGPAAGLASLLGRALPGACRLLPGPDDNLSQLCFKVTFQPFLLSCGKGGGDRNKDH